MHQVSIQEAASSLPGLIREALQGAEVVITQDNKPVAKLTPIAERAPAEKAGPKAGGARGQIWMADDFDAPLPDFKDYM